MSLIKCKKFKQSHQLKLMKIRWNQNRTINNLIDTIQSIHRLNFPNPKILIMINKTKRRKQLIHLGLRFSKSNKLIEKKQFFQIKVLEEKKFQNTRQRQLEDSQSKFFKKQKFNLSGIKASLLIKKLLSQTTEKKKLEKKEKYDFKNDLKRSYKLENVPEFKYSISSLKGQQNIISSKKEETDMALAIESCMKLRRKYQIFQEHYDYVDLEKLLKSKSDEVNEPIIDYNKTKDIDLPPDFDDELELLDGYISTSRKDYKDKFGHIPNIYDFLKDVSQVLHNFNQKITNQHANTRLQNLQELYKLHRAQFINSEKIMNQNFTKLNQLNIEIFITQEKSIISPFYNLVFFLNKSQVMSKQNLEQLLNLIYFKEEKDVVINEQGQTLGQAFEELGYTHQTISIDALEIESIKDDIPQGAASQLIQKLFLSYDNFNKGKYYGDLTKMCMGSLEEQKYVFTEWRLPFKGHDYQEWDQMATWINTHELQSHQNRWIIQFTNHFSTYVKDEKYGIKNFGDFMDNLMMPLFEATLYPSKHPELFKFLLSVKGFDIENSRFKFNPLIIQELLILPQNWEHKRNPPFPYFLFYLWANIQSLNTLRASLNLNTFQLRPMVGQVGTVDHLASAFLLCDSINQPIILKDYPFALYMYYMSKIGITMSTFSSLDNFKNQENPFLNYFQIGINLSLSTVSPLLNHMTRTPLLEEFSIASQFFNLTNVDLAELCINSLKQSGFEAMVKKHWFGDFQTYNEDPTLTNDQQKTNLPHIRHTYRLLQFQQEVDYILNLLEDHYEKIKKQQEENLKKEQQQNQINEQKDESKPNDDQKEENHKEQAQEKQDSELNQQTQENQEKQEQQQNQDDQKQQDNNDQQENQEK